MKIQARFRMSHRNKVLSAFKKLHRTSKNVFVGDVTALNAARVQINGAFVANKNLNDEVRIKDEIKQAEDVEEILRKQVLQAALNDHGNYELKLRKDIALQSNDKPYTPMPEHMIGPFKKK